MKCVGANDKAKLTDVSENSKNLNIREVDAARTAANLDSIDAAIINNDFVTEAGIDPKTAIYVEPASKNTKQWYNLLVAQKVGKNQIRLMLSRKLSRLIILTKSKRSSRNHLKVWMNQFGKRTLWKELIFAGGCFWCMVQPFEEQEGILSVRSGYTGGHVPNPTYEEVCRKTDWPH